MTICFYLESLSDPEVDDFIKNFVWLIELALTFAQNTAPKFSI